jgi:hypothetical protein
MIKIYQAQIEEKSPGCANQEMNMFSLPRITATFSMLLLICSMTAVAQEDDQTAITPMRLSYADGNVSFWRYGATDWVDAQLNTPLAAGDSLYVGNDGDLELQMDSRDFVRADDDTQLTLVNQTPDYFQFKITTGRVTFDLRALPTGNSVELDTPNAVFTIDHVGYYRLDVDDDVHFITRRGGRAMVTPAGGQAMSIYPSEEIVVSGTTMAQAVTYVAPVIDGWDRWNYDRTDSQLDAVSERYLPYGVAGASDLDNYGNWRVVPDYGPIWVPDDVPPGWAPYSTGSWGWDPYYQWTWVDDEPWGWAPFHYGRWVYLNGYWAWAPGPVIRHPVYAPALVAFFDVGPNVSIGFSSAGMGWVALSWGEPLTPWWGRPNFIGRPWWGGWGGPRVVNNQVIHNNSRVDMNRIRYNNTHVRDAVVATTHEHFGTGRVRDEHVPVTQTRELKHVRGALPVKPRPESLVAGARNGARPPERILSRPVVATRPPQESRLPWRVEASRQEGGSAQERRYMLVPRQSTNNLPRPAFGGQTGAERPRPPLPPSFPERRREAVPYNTGPAQTGPVSPNRSQSGSNATRDIPPQSAKPQPGMQQRTTREVVPQGAAQERDQTRQESRRIFAPQAEQRATPAENRQQTPTDLPGRPANRVFSNENQQSDRGDQRWFQRQPDNSSETRRNP